MRRSKKAELHLAARRRLFDAIPESDRDGHKRPGSLKKSGGSVKGR